MAALFLDANAGAPLRSGVLAALQAAWPALSVESSATHAPEFANPSSTHSHGRAAQRLIRAALTSVATSLGLDRDRESELLWCASGTEANQWAIRSVLANAAHRLSNSNEPIHWITTAVEHECVLGLAEAKGETLLGWDSARFKVDVLPVDRYGVPRWELLPALLRPHTVLVSAIWVNNETGVLSQWESVAALCGEKKIHLHLDGAQAWGKLPIAPDGLRASSIAFAGAKIGALPGTGVLWWNAQNQAHLKPLFGGRQQSGRRGGTENLPGIISLGAAAAELNPAQFREVSEPVRASLEQALATAIPGLVVNGQGADRVAGTLNISLPHIRGGGIAAALDRLGFSVSEGSACASGAPEPSHVLLAMGLPPELAQASVRISWLTPPTQTQCNALVDALSNVARRLASS